ncbi:MAG: PilZ domain-containing protein [Endomicrobia bacterium]|nr:PilZ domain-containing protein [Endomicrobiia bacterium]
MVSEKRKHQRMPVIKKFDEPIIIDIGGKQVPGVILDLSADGMQLLTYANIPLNTELFLSLNLPNLKTDTMRGKVVWQRVKDNMFLHGMHITDMNTLDAKHINRMAIDYNDCENKIILGVPDVCYEKCSYFNLCEKPQKIKNK